MADGRVGLTPEQEGKLNYLYRFVRKLEVAFAPPRPLAEEEDIKTTEQRLAEVMAQEPSAEDLMFWSLPGPLPSEARAAEASGDQGSER